MQIKAHVNANLTCTCQRTCRRCLGCAIRSTQLACYCAGAPFPWPQCSVHKDKMEVCAACVQLTMHSQSSFHSCLQDCLTLRAFRELRSDVENCSTAVVETEVCRRTPQKVSLCAETKVRRWTKEEVDSFIQTVGAGQSA